MHQDNPPRDTGGTLPATMPLASPGTRLDTLWAVHEIRQLALRYTLAMDAHDADLMLSLWVPEPQAVTFPDLDITTVREAIIPSWRTAGPSVMFVANHLVDVADEGTATGSVYCLVRIVLNGRMVEQAVLYSDEYACGDNGAWLFRRRRHRLFYGRRMGENPWDQPPADWPRHQVGRGELPDEFPTYGPEQS